MSTVGLTFTDVWDRICTLEGETFRQIRGGQFTYSVSGNAISLSTTNQIIARRELEKAFEMLPVENTVPFQDLRAPSYLYALLTDERVIGDPREDLILD